MRGNRRKNNTTERTRVRGPARTVTANSGWVSDYGDGTGDGNGILQKQMSSQVAKIDC